MDRPPFTEQLRGTSHKAETVTLKGKEESTGPYHRSSAKGEGVHERNMKDSPISLGLGARKTKDGNRQGIKGSGTKKEGKPIVTRLCQEITSRGKRMAGARAVRKLRIKNQIKKRFKGGRTSPSAGRVRAKMKREPHHRRNLPTGRASWTGSSPEQGY